MRALYQKDNDFLLIDDDQSPRPGYSPADRLPLPEDADKYTYHWLRADGMHTTGRYGLLRAQYGIRTDGRQKPTRKPRSKDRLRLQARLRRLRNREYWYRQRKSLFADQSRWFQAKVQDLRRKIRKTKAQLLIEKRSHESKR